MSDSSPSLEEAREVSRARSSVLARAARYAADSMVGNGEAAFEVLDDTIGIFEAAVRADSDVLWSVTLAAAQANTRTAEAEITLLKEALVEAVAEMDKNTFGSYVRAHMALRAALAGQIGNQL